MQKCREAKSNNSLLGRGIVLMGPLVLSGEWGYFGGWPLPEKRGACSIGRAGEECCHREGDGLWKTRWWVPGTALPAEGR